VGERGQRASGGLIPTISPPFAHAPCRMPMATRIAVRFFAHSVRVWAWSGPAPLNEHVFCYFYRCLFRYSALTEVLKSVLRRCVASLLLSIVAILKTGRISKGRFKWLPSICHWLLWVRPVLH
jgi:hypothetical protein